MASIIAAKAVDVQYEIVGKAQNLDKQVSPDYNVGFVGTTALTKLNILGKDLYAILTQPQNVGQTGAAFDTKLTALEEAVNQVRAAS